VPGRHTFGQPGILLRVLQKRDLESYLRDDTEHCALPGLEIGRGMRGLDQRLTEA
jgi:hypothetical protein